MPSPVRLTEPLREPLRSRSEGVWLLTRRREEPPPILASVGDTERSKSAAPPFPPALSVKASGS